MKDTIEWKPAEYPPVILASASPRRLELLRQVGINPMVEPSHMEEVLKGTEPEQVVAELSVQKAGDIADRHTGEEVVVVGADTVVSVDGRILGKPKDRDDAICMISMLEGRVHQVFTGVTLVFCGKERSEVTFVERTDVRVCPMTRSQIEAYVDTGEPMDKAGAYGIQGQFAAWVEGISGDYNNVVGLPVGRVYREIMKNEY